MVKQVKRFKIYNMKQYIHKSPFYVHVCCYVYTIACFLLLTGCFGSKKTSTSKHEAVKISEQITEVSISENSIFVDTSKTSNGEVTYTRIEFYHPEPIEPDQVPVALGEVPVHGPVKSIETLIIKSNTEEKGITENQNIEEAVKETNINNDTEKFEATAKEPAKDPYRYRYIFGILVIIIVVAGFFWLRKSGFIQKIVSLFK